MTALREAGVRSFEMYIDGRWTSAESGETFRSEDPYTGEAWAEIPKAGAADVDRAVMAARRAFDEGPWSRTSPAERARLLRRLAALIAEHGERLARLEVRDNGKLLREMSGQLANLPGNYEWAAAEAEHDHDREHRTLYALTTLLGLPIGTDVLFWAIGLESWRTPYGVSLMLVAALVGSGRIIYGALEALAHGRVGADVALALASTAALILGEYFVAAEVVFIALCALVFTDLLLGGLIAMLIFVIVMEISVLYAWRKGILTWK